MSSYPWWHNNKKQSSTHNYFQHSTTTVCNKPLSEKNEQQQKHSNGSTLSQAIKTISTTTRKREGGEEREGKERERERERLTDWLIDLFIERMTVLGRGLVFQLVLVTHTCTYSNNNIITLQNIDISRERERGRETVTERKKDTVRWAYVTEHTTNTNMKITTVVFHFLIFTLSVNMHLLFKRCLQTWECVL